MKKREENVVEVYGNTQTKDRAPVMSAEKYPAIKDIYDPLSGLHDGTITPNAPILVVGENLCPVSSGKVLLGLSPADDKGRFIEIRKIYKYSNIQILVSLPMLEPGEYFLVMKVCMEDNTDFICPLPMSPWRVVEEREMDLFAGSMRRNFHRH